MSFFPSDDGALPPPALPEAEETPVERDEARGQFPGEFGVPVSIPQARIIFEEVALAFDQYLVFDAGFYVTLRVLQRAPMVDRHDRDLAESLFAGADQMPYSKRFRWGIQLSDGRRGYGLPLEQSDADFAISGRSGGGDDVMARYRFWVHAVPTAEMTIFVAWPARGLEERSLVVDGTALVEASVANTRVTGW